MASRKVTTTLPETQVEKIRALGDAEHAPGLPRFVQHAVAVALDDVADWEAVLADALRESGGPLSDDERAWADGVLGTEDAGARRRPSA